MDKRTLKFRKEDYIFRDGQGNVTSTAQLDFLMDFDSYLLGFIGGLGSGKTHIFLRKTLDMHVNKKNKMGRSNMMILYPTFDLVEELFWYPYLELMESQGIDYYANESKHMIKTGYGNMKCFQLQTPEKIVGRELTAVGVDEFDVANWRQCNTAFNKIIGRLRGCEHPQLYMVTSPEGRHYTYKIFEEDKEKYGSKYFIGNTRHNTHLPASYVPKLEQMYDAAMLTAYRDGLFVNLTSGTVYRAFGPHNLRPVQIEERLPLVIMCDFNRGDKPMCWNVGQIIGDELRIKWALHKHKCDTYMMCEYLESHLYENLNIGQNDRLPPLVFYGDYSGNKETSNSRKTDWNIIQDHFADKAQRVEIKVKPTASVRDGVNATNAKLHNGQGKSSLFIDPEAKWLIRDFELTVWDASGMKEDQSNDDRSHAVSAVRYLVDFEFPMRQRIRRV